MTAMRQFHETGPLANNILEMQAASFKSSEVSQPYAVARGVVWTRVFMTTTGDMNARPDWHITANIDDITLYLRANEISEEELRAFMDAVDYDGLNGLLAEPVPGIGSAAPEMTPLEEKLYADRVLLDQRDAAEARLDRAKQSDRREGQVLSRIASLSPQGIVVKKRVETRFDSLGFPDRSGSGDGTVLSLDEIRARVEAFPDRNTSAFGMYMAEFSLANGLDVRDTFLKYDGLWPGAEADTARFAAGQMAETEAGYSVRKAEADGDLPVGSCLQIQTGHVVCETVAERFRVSYAGRRINKDWSWQDEMDILLEDHQHAQACTRRVETEFAVLSEDALRAKAAMSDDERAHLEKSALRRRIDKGYGAPDFDITYHPYGAVGESDTRAFVRGEMARSDPRYAVLKTEADRRLPIGSCLSTQTGVHCTQHAEYLRTLREIKRQEAGMPGAASDLRRASLDNSGDGGSGAAGSLATPLASTAMAAQALQAVPDPQDVVRSREEIKVNRFSHKRQSSRSSGCGGTSFCRVDN